MKIFVINYSDISGGAARAAYRIHHAVRRLDIDSVMQVIKASAGDWTVKSTQTTFCRRISSKLRAAFAIIFKKLLKTSNSVLHSPAILPSRLVAKLNRSEADVLHMHWINGEMLSVEDIGRLRKPIVWTLHDMWAFCGAEHYTEEFRWKDGYKSNNRPTYESGFDLNRWVWKRKRSSWKKPMHIVTPSNWLAECARKSILLKDFPITVIHNAIDTETWKPIDKDVGRKLLNLPCDVPLLLFGAMGGSNDPRKGFDLLKQALQHLSGKVRDLQLVIFGQLAPYIPEDLCFPINYTGHLHDDLSLRILYSAADVMVIPSRQDNLPNTGVESLACGTPVVAFNTCGLPDIVTHNVTGYLASAFDPDDLAKGIQWVLEDEQRYERLSINSRKDAVTRFSYPAIAEQYKCVYQNVVDSV